MVPRFSDGSENRKRLFCFELKMKETTTYGSRRDGNVREKRLRKHAESTTEPASMLLKMALLDRSKGK